MVQSDVIPTWVTETLQANEQFDSYTSVPVSINVQNT